MAESRICNRCLRDLHLSKFSINSKGKYGVKSICKECSNKAEGVRRRRYQKEDPKTFSFKRHESKLRYGYGITTAQYDNLYFIQGGKCAICQVKGSSYFEAHPTQNYFHVDHCHHTKQVRGLLCTNCNSGMGKLQDSEVILNRALDYLRNPPFTKLKP
jgi:hypothetical protein